MAPAVSASLLFHPKKVAKRKIPLPERNKASTTPLKARPVSQQQQQTTTTTTTATTTTTGDDPDDAVLQLPDVPFQEFRLMSSALNGWRYDVMKFDSRKPVDISTWQAPIKLNRKELRRDDGAGVGAPVAVAPMLGVDGKPVIGVDGRVVMLDAEGRPIHPLEAGGIGGGGGGGATSGNRDGKTKQAANGRKKFQKKTRQVFLVPEATRQLRREERHPWVMEDASLKEVWVGKLEEVSKSETHAFFMPAANDVFKFVPAHRWYKFQKKPNYRIPSLEEAESIMAKHQRNRDPERWLLHNRNGKGPSAATAVFRAESEGRGLPGNSTPQSLGPGGRKLKTVDSGMDTLFDDDDDDANTKRRRRKEYDGEGDMDEMEYEEDFADDEEKVEEDNDDEEAKELEERLKREYKSANKQREGYVDESEDEEEGYLTRDGKAMKKLIRNLEKNTAYESDDEKNPYASSEDEEEEEEEAPVVAAGHDATQLPQPAAVPPSSSRSGSQTPKNRSGTPGRGQPASASTAVPTNGSTNVSRVTSPAPVAVAVANAGGGHSLVAKRATSPKLRTGGGGSTAPGSRPGSRAVSPVPKMIPNVNQKRKATEDGSSAPKPKKRKATLGGLAPVGELEDRMVIDWLRSTPNASTRDCIQHFTPYLTDEAKKSQFTALVKEVAQLKGGVLVLRNAYRAGS